MLEGNLELETKVVALLSTAKETQKDASDAFNTSMTEALAKAEVISSAAQTAIDAFLDVRRSLALPLAPLSPPSRL
jgi:hypothetical protein